MPQPDTVPRRIAPVPMEVFAAEPDPEVASETVRAKPAEPSACQIRVADKIAVIQPLPSFGGPGDCGASDVVKLEAIIQPDKSRVVVSPPATIRCSMAEALATWVREDLTEMTGQFGSAPRALDNYASYDCRGRNRVAGAKISEHGLANAIDVRGVHLANGRFADFTDRKLAREFREAVRKSVCARFTTVLGPGSDGHHETHIHVDLAQRRGGYRLCQWNVLDPAGEVPLPRPRPEEAP
ncbi:extensin family protein [Pseudorhodoplanes sp.]|uniref:extensin-like domain-containing protein n=1 Tax=Pseudorhodoplanes sp. TaxID=1934341 RepID=UPI002CF53221|nr:extensin family protein [Pseudorhodoplanes sp.]HWV55607.1 extensin family protein [Pseudorhodoplanes sp.]